MEDCRREDRWLFKEDVNLTHMTKKAVFFDRWHVASSRAGSRVWVPIVFEDGFLL
jgi:hypothetical protein